MLKFFIVLMIMSINFQFLYDNPFSLPYISYKMICIYNFGCIPSNFVVYNELFSFRVRNLKMKEKESIHPPLYKSLSPSCAHLIGYLKASWDKHINSVPAVPGMSVPIKIFICLRYRDCLES